MLLTKLVRLFCFSKKFGIHVCSSQILVQDNLPCKNRSCYVFCIICKSRMRAYVNPLYSQFVIFKPAESYRNNRRQNILFLFVKCVDIFIEVCTFDMKNFFDRLNWSEKICLAVLQKCEEKEIWFRKCILIFFLEDEKFLNKRVLILRNASLILLSSIFRRGY